MNVVVQQIFYFRFSYFVLSSKQTILHHVNSGNDMIRDNVNQDKILCCIFTKGCESLTDTVYTESLSNIFLLDKYFHSIFLSVMLSYSIFILSFNSYSGTLGVEPFPTAEIY